MYQGVENKIFVKIIPELLRTNKYFISSIFKMDKDVAGTELGQYLTHAFGTE